MISFFFFQAEDGIRDWSVTGVQTCALPIYVKFANATGYIDTHQSKFIDRVVKNLNGELHVRQGNRRAGPNPPGVFALRVRHLLVPHYCGVTALPGRQVREIDRKRAERADHADLMAKTIHMFELPVEIEPFSP